MTSRPTFTCAVLLLTSLLLTACASTPVSPLALEQARDVLRQTVDAGAEASAPLEVRAARERLDEAIRAAQARDGRLAGMRAQESVLNSELAMARAAASRARDAERRAREENQRLQRELRELFNEEKN